MKLFSEAAFCCKNGDTCMQKIDDKTTLPNGTGSRRIALGLCFFGLFLASCTHSAPVTNPTTPSPSKISVNCSGSGTASSTMPVFPGGSCTLQNLTNSAVHATITSSASWLSLAVSGSADPTRFSSLPADMMAGQGISISLYIDATGQSLGPHVATISIASQVQTTVVVNYTLNVVSN